MQTLMEKKETRSDDDHKENKRRKTSSSDFSCRAMCTFVEKKRLPLYSMFWN